MGELLTKLVLPITLLLNLWHPQVLGDSINMNYPFTLGNSSDVCSNYDDCCSYCIDGLSETEDQCNQFFPECTEVDEENVYTSLQNMDSKSVVLKDEVLKNETPVDTNINDSTSNSNSGFDSGESSTLIEGSTFKVVKRDVRSDLETARSKESSTSASVKDSDYSFDFSVSGDVCHSYDDCWDYCAYDRKSAVDVAECDKFFPGATVIANGWGELRGFLDNYVRLKKGESYTFEIKMLDEKGTEIEGDPTKVDWKVVNGGGVINEKGVFVAGNSAGMFSNTVKVQFKDQVFYASVEIVEDGESKKTVGELADSYVKDSSETEVSNGVVEESAIVPVKVFDYLNERVDGCLRDVFTDDEYRRYFAPEGQHADLDELGERLYLMEQCVDLKKVPDLDRNTEDCLKREWGKERFRVLLVGNDELTSEEQNKANVCFDGLNLVNYDYKERLDSITEGCLRVKLGNDRFDQVNDGLAVPSQNEIDLGRECFDLDTNIVRPPVVIVSSDNQSGCLQSVLGEKRYKEIYEKGFVAKENEKEAVQVCFGFVDKVMQEFLPVPPGQVAFLPEEKDVIGVDVLESKTRLEQDVLSLSGKGPVNSLIDIYIFSQPIVVTTKTDANGDWTYDLAYHLPEGDHRVYTVSRHPSKGLVRSEVVNFNVAYARGGGNDSSPELLVTRKSSDDKMKGYLLAAGSIVMFGVVSLLIVYQMKMERSRIDGGVIRSESLTSDSSESV